MSEEFKSAYDEVNKENPQTKAEYEKGHPDKTICPFFIESEEPTCAVTKRSLLVDQRLCKDGPEKYKICPDFYEREP